MTTTLTTTKSPVADPTSAPRRISLEQSFANTFTMAYRGILKIKHNPEQLFDVVIQPIIFTLMFTYIFGGAIAGDVTAYLPTIIPGILVQTVITGSIVTGTQLREDMDKGVFDRFKSLPIARIAPSPAPCSPTSCGTESPPPSRSSWASPWDTARPVVRSASCPPRFW